MRKYMKLAAVIVFLVFLLVEAGMFYLIYLYPWTLLVIGAASLVLWKLALRDSIEVPSSDPNF